MNGQITRPQYDLLMKNLNATRIARRNAGGKSLSYLESWDVRATLIRVFGFGNFDAEVESAELMFERETAIGKEQKPGIEVAYKVVFRITIRDPEGRTIATYAEGAVGSASGSVGFGDLHDNALKTAASDALKRCAINLGTQFGLSLYNNGNRNDVVRMTLVAPVAAQYEDALTLEELKASEGWPEGTLFIAIPPEDNTGVTAEQLKMLEHTLGATQIEPSGEGGNEGAVEEPAEPVADDPALASEATARGANQ